MGLIEKINIYYNSEQIISEVFFEPTEISQYKFSCYLFKNGIKVQVKWYSDDRVCIFNTGTESGYYYPESVGMQPQISLCHRRGAF